MAIDSTKISGFFPVAAWRRRAIGAAAVWFFVCLLWGAPAQLLAAMLKPLLPQLQLLAIDGGFWNGSAGQAFWQQDGKVMALGKIEWQLSPGSLLWLHPSAHIATRYGEQFVDTHIRFSPRGRIVLYDTSAAIPVQLVGYWLPLPAKGLLDVKLARAEFSRRRVDKAEGDIYWQQAQWQWGAQWLALGDYRCTLHMETAGDLHCVLQGQGALAGTGDVEIDFNKKNWSAAARLKPDAKLPEDFRQTVAALLAVKVDAQNQWQIRRNGSWQ